MPNAMSSIRDLQIARQHVYQALTSDPAIVESCGPITTIRSQKAGKRWAQNAEFACLCCKLKGQVSFVLCNTQEEVYARQVSKANYMLSGVGLIRCKARCDITFCLQLIAYKLAVTRQLQGIPVLLSPIDCTTRYWSPRCYIPCWVCV